MVVTPPTRSDEDLETAAVEPVVGGTGDVDESREQLLTPGEAARVAGLTVSALTALARSGRLSSIRTAGGHRRYVYGELLDALHRERPQLLGSVLPRPVVITQGRHAGIRGELIAVDAETATVRASLGGRPALLVVMPGAVQDR